MARTQAEEARRAPVGLSADASRGPDPCCARDVSGPGSTGSCSPTSRQSVKILLIRRPRYRCWRRRVHFMPRWLLGVACWLLLALPALPVEQVTFRKNGATHRASGKVLVTDDQGGVLLLSRDGTLRSIE